MLKKTLILISIFIVTPILAGIYGIVHDQITSSISPEYFTKFKFEQFNVAPALPFRAAVSVVGWKATWWVGIPMGLVLGLVGLIHSPWKSMLQVSLKSLGIIFSVALIMGFIGLLYGKIVLLDQYLDWYLPSNLVDRKHFVMVGSMHNFSYLGGAIGLIVAVVYQIFHKRKSKKSLINQ